MLEYTLDDAEALLLKNQETAVKSLAQVEEDLGFLRDQTTTLEVSILFTGNSLSGLAFICLFFRGF